MKPKEPNSIVRVGTRVDLPRVLELIVELAVYEKEPDAVKTSVESMLEDGFGANPVYGFFVAEDEQKSIVGLSLYYWRYSTWKGKRLYLEDLIVTESARGKGYGKALFERTLQFAKEQNCTGMVWQVLDWNEPSIEFYKSYGAEFDKGWLNCSISW
ncbi:MAG TPA: GNAT family N-acetyltransferase [Planctomycetaceae bacterium]|nr:GNAT family N-acetyltransferase [Planctomycetaceae bacterium]